MARVSSSGFGRYSTVFLPKDSSSSTSQDDEITSNAAKTICFPDPFQYSRAKKFRDSHLEVKKLKRRYTSTELNYISDVCADGNPISDPNGGPYCTTGPNAVSGVKLFHRESRLRQIGDSVSDIAELRIKRRHMHDKAMARANRHQHGAGMAVQARLSQQQRKKLRKSLGRSRKLLARVAVMGNMIMYDESAWLAFYRTLHSSGVLGALLDTGETASAATAKKALAVAALANKNVASRDNFNGVSGRRLAARRRKIGVQKKIMCYWCTSLGHYGRECPSKKKGEPPAPGSKVAKERAKKASKKKK